MVPRLANRDDRSVVSVIGELARQRVLIRRNDKLTGSAGDGGCGQSCSDGVPEPRIKVFKGLVEPGERQRGRGGYHKQMCDNSRPCPLTSAKGVPSEFLACMDACDRSIRLESEASIGEQLFPSPPNFASDRRDARFNHPIGCCTQGARACQRQGLSPVGKLEFTLVLAKLII